MDKGYKYTKKNDEFTIRAKDLSNGSGQRIELVCDYCGKKYTKPYYSFIKSRMNIDKDACIKCGGLKMKESTLNDRAKEQFSLLLDVCKQNNYTLITDISEFTNVLMEVKFICPKHGLQTMMFDNLKRGHKCKDCSYEYRGNNLKYSIDHISNIINSTNENILLNKNDYKDVFTHNLQIRCKCGNIYETSFANFTKHEVNQCFSCSNKESKAETKIRYFLEKNNIEFEQEKRFKDCKDIKPLPFDFYLPKYNLCIEFDGQHHYYQTRSLKDYEATIKHDKMKNDYCKDNNINLLRIPYWDGSNIEKILTKELNI